MKAVNLIPLDARRGSDAPSRSGGAVYGVLAILGVLAVIAVVYGMSARSLSTQEQTLQQLQADGATGAGAAAALQPYVRFGQIADEREQTVITIAGQRFDWGLAMREIARVLPDEVDLLSVDGQRRGTTPGATPEVAGAAAGAPQITLIGCTTSQASVALLMARLRAIAGVDRVKLESSTKGEAGGGGGTGSTGDCRGGNQNKPQFTMIVLFRSDDPAAQAATAAPGAAPAAATGDPAAATSGTEEGAS